MLFLKIKKHSLLRLPDLCIKCLSTFFFLDGYSVLNYYATPDCHTVLIMFYVFLAKKAPMEGLIKLPTDNMVYKQYTKHGLRNDKK